MAAALTNSEYLSRLMQGNRGQHGSSDVHFGQLVRWVSLAGGSALAALGLRQRSAGGLLMAAAGGMLLYEGTRRHVPVFARLGFEMPEPGDVKDVNCIEETVTVGRPREEVYAFWRQLDNLPRFMRHLALVKMKNGEQSYWEAQLSDKTGKVTLAWNAEIVEDEPGERIAWRSLSGGDVYNAGTVRFQDAPGGRGTEVHVAFEYQPPAGKAGLAVARLFNPVFSELVRNDIRRFKSLLEAGEIPSIEGQTHGANEE